MARIDNPDFWSEDVTEDITICVKLDPRVVTWASTLDSRQLKAYGFNSDNKYTLPKQKDLCAQIEEVVNAVNDDGVLVSKYSQMGRPLDFHASDGLVSNLPACIRSMFMKDFRDLDVSSAQHRIHEIVTKTLVPDVWSRYTWFWEELKDKATRTKLASELNITPEEAKQHLNTIWNTREPRANVNDEFRDFERTAWNVRDRLFVHPSLRFLRKLAEDKCLKDRKDNVKGTFMSNVYNYVMNKVLLALRDTLGAESMVSLIHDGCHIHSTAEDAALITAAEDVSRDVLGDPLKWNFKPPEFRVKQSGTELYTTFDLSQLVRLEEYVEDKIQVQFPNEEEYVDAKVLAQKLGESLTQLCRIKMKKATREEKIRAQKEAALLALNRRYKLVDDCYVDTQCAYPKKSFKLIALNKFGKTMRCTTVEYDIGPKGGLRRFNLA